MLDTNILVSAIVFTGEPIKNLIKQLSDNYSIVLCSYVIDELHDVISEKFPLKADAIEQFLHELPFELVYTPQTLPSSYNYDLRDKKDDKVLYSAILSDVDILITGDNGFFEIEIEKPEILKPFDFVKFYR
jgi:putative PIN family toxin of toxin-antitoxin system